MNQFQYVRATKPQGAIDVVAKDPQAKFIAGGTNLVDLMKERVEQPALLIDVGRLALTAVEATPQGGLRLGALARNADTAAHPLVRERYPLLRNAL